MSVSLGQLVIRLEGNVVQTFPLTAPVVMIGRTPGNDLTLAHPLVSRKHAELRLEFSGAILTDVGSSNGTFVDGQRMLANQPRLLASGASFQIGPFVVTYLGPADVQQPSGQVEPGVEAVQVGGQPSIASFEPDPSPLGLAAEPVVIEARQPYRPVPPRPTLPALLAEGPISHYLTYLPMIFHESDFLARFLLIFESVWEPMEQRQDHIDMYFDPRTAPRAFLPWLASWLDVSFNAHWPEARVRRLLSEAMELYRWRGTKYGMEHMIEVCTGIVPEITDDPSQPFVFRVRVTLPPDGTIDAGLIEDLIQSHKPAHTGFVLETVS